MDHLKHKCQQTQPENFAILVSQYRKKKESPGVPEAVPEASGASHGNPGCARSVPQHVVAAQPHERPFPGRLLREQLHAGVHLGVGCVVCLWGSA